MKINYFPSLTGVRAIAAFMVVIHHTFHDYFSSAYLNSILRELNTGVNIFFVLSGFLIWYRYSENFTFHKTSLRTYIINRIARIYPVYFILTTITMLLLYILHNLEFKEALLTYLLNISLLNGFSSEFVYTGIPQGWTLSVEELFYISAPILMFFNLKRKTGLFPIGMIILAIGLLLHFLFTKIQFLGFFDDLKYMRINTYFGRFTEFFIGIFLAKHFKKLKHISSKIPIYTYLGAILIIVSVVFVLPFFQNDTDHYSIQTWPGYLFNVIIFPVFVAIFFLGLISESSLVNSFLGSKTMILLGKSSYSLYLVHYGIIATLFNSLVFKNKLLFLIGIYIISIAIWKFIEEPLNKRIRKFN